MFLFFVFTKSNITMKKVHEINKQLHRQTEQINSANTHKRLKKHIKFCKILMPQRFAVRSQGIYGHSFLLV